ncbi:MAG: hypothetical protein DSY76_01845 [Bacteroidetes bacterium]|nr:MAG: hypothetical protein DSY76_01845 [Bacteroidota bacterium]
MKNSFILWTITIVITVSTMIYQRATGPTYPKHVKVELGNQEYKFKLLRSNEIGSPCDIQLPIEDKDVKAKIYYKKYKTNDELTIVDMERIKSHKKAFFGEGDEIEVLTTTLPEQPAAGKITYYIELIKGNDHVFIQKEEPVVVRFKGFVPRYILIPHVLFMIISLFAGTRAGVEAIAGGDKTRKFAIVTLIVLFIGGLILGPIVQLYAFGELWTGWPFGGDWTDNKTLFAWIFWLIAVIVLKKKPHNRLWPIIAVIVLFAMYMIPHSMGGSELNNETGKIETGMKE